MQNTINIGWLDVSVRQVCRLTILDHGRLPRAIAQLPDPENQYPSLCVFLGGKRKKILLLTRCWFPVIFHVLFGLSEFEGSSMFFREVKYLLLENRVYFGSVVSSDFKYPFPCQASTSILL
jgi:hypothetical protein